MLKKAAGLLLVCAGVATWMSCSATVSHFVYAALPSANEVGIYREDPNSGVLTQLADSPFAAGNGAESVVVHPSKKFMYVANAVDNSISLFTIASNGEITEVTPRTQSGSTPTILAIDSAGTFLYEADSGSNSITVYSIDASSGALTEVTNFRTGHPLNIKLNPAGTVLYVTVTESPTGFVLAFSMNSGKVSSVIGTFSTGGASPYGLFVDPKGKYLYVTNAAPDNSIAEFTIGSDGGLTPIAGSPIGQADGINPLSVVVDPSGTYMYVANEGSNNVTAYTVASDGSISPLATPTFATGTQPSFLVMDPNGKYLLVGNQSSGIEVFSLSTGDLDTVTTFATGSNPSSLAITP
ncbi:MAG TPA: beta-propeller fold lactonase family protein [Candidatus Sulfotelmatobacter sp.]|jgi:6-phosphogluconolactonase